jgi:N-acetylglucosaminyldiphosphoundecaprenol N-acetyl-beta-D-mannosaminyltransferase
VSSHSNAIPRVNVLGVGIHVLDMNQALALVTRAAETPGQSAFVTATGVHGVMESQADPALRAIHNQAFLTLPDGAPMAWMARLRGHRHAKQVAGVDFFRAVTGAAEPHRHFFFGGGEGVAERLRQALEQRAPECEVVACVTPPYRPLSNAETSELLAQVHATKPHFFWVGLSTPKQERFMAQLCSQVQFADQGFVMCGVGAAFDFVAGTAKEAPRWLRGTGFEWLYRLVQEPRRLAKRYLSNNPRFVLRILDQWLRPKRYPL